LPPKTPVPPTGGLAIPRGLYSVGAAAHPYWNAGVFLYTDDNNEDKMATAAVVRSNRILLTAGHAVRNPRTGKWFSNFLFMQAARNWNGRWWSGWRLPITRVGCWENISGGNFMWDYAFCQTGVETRHEGFSLTATTPPMSASSLGYPGKWDDYPDEREYWSELCDADGVVSDTGDNILKMTLNRGIGTSGGPWIENLSGSRDDVSNVIVSVNSHVRTGEKQIVYGPRFDDNTMRLYNCIMSGEPCGPIP
jgi:hypothetical protein